MRARLTHREGEEGPEGEEGEDGGEADGEWKPAEDDEENEEEDEGEGEGLSLALVLLHHALDALEGVAGVQGDDLFTVRSSR